MQKSDIYLARRVAMREKSERTGQVRCLACFERFRVPKGTEKMACPHCGGEWYISWSGPLAKIRKPVWESWERREAEMQQKGR
jgi:rRNA maturation endonuclease Nob1